MPDDHGYPTKDELQRIRAWDYRDPNGLLAFVKTVWWAADWGWHEQDTADDDGDPVRRYNISTGGWSGNEDTVDALRANRMFWSMCWVSTRRGGHYVFEVDQ